MMKDFSFPIFTIIVFTFFGCSYSAQLKKGRFTQVEATQTIPFDLKHNLLFTTVEINGKKKRFIIDSGAPNVIDKSIQEELGLKTVYKTGIRDISGRAKTLEFVKIDQFQFGDVVVKNTVAAVTDFSVFTCLNIDGILGTNIMSHFDWQLDYQNQEATLYKTSVPDSIIEQYAIATPLILSTQKSPYIDIKYKKNKKFRTEIDLGSAHGLSLKTWASLNKSDYPNQWIYGQTSKGIYGALIDTTHYIKTSDFSIESAPLPELIFKTHAKSTSSFGNKFLKHYKVLLSWKNKKLYLNPVTPPDTTFSEKEIYFGFDNEKIIVKNITSKSSFFDQNLKIGNQVLSINGKDVSHITEANYCNLDPNWIKINDFEVKLSNDSILQIHLDKK